MESFFRGSIEQKIETWLDDDEIKQVYDIVSYLQQIKIGIEDVILGFIIASLYDSLINLCFAHYYRVPNDDEISELMDIIKRRTGEIKQRINYVVNQ
jgi:hypothetical protein